MAKKDITHMLLAEVGASNKKGMILMADYAVRRNQFYPPQHKMAMPESCPAQFISPLPANYSVAMLYVPMQTDTSMFDEMKALECGTLFPVLSKPFFGRCCK